MNLVARFKEWKSKRRAQEFSRVRQILDQITYKPGFHWALFESDGPYLKIVYLPVQDRDHPETQTEIHSNGVLERNLPPHKIVRKMFEHIKSVEIHETQEFFKFRGDRIFDPHTPFENKKKWKTLRKESRWWQIKWPNVWVGFWGGSTIASLGSALTHHFLGWSHNLGLMIAGNLVGAVIAAKWSDR